MGSQFVQYFTIFFLFFLFLNPGTSVAETPPSDQLPFSSSALTTQLDGVPIVNPTPPSTTGPIDNPMDSPPAPMPPATTIPQIPPAAMNPNPTSPTSSRGQWCIASPTESETALQVALDYACGYGGADCSALQPGASCYNPNTVIDHASYAFNDYYQKNPAPTSCVFGGTAQLTSTNPSTGNCHFSSSKSTPSMTPPANLPPIPTTTTPTTTAPTIMSPPIPTTTTPTTTTPTIMSPPMSTTPEGPTVFGVAEPTGSPNSASSLSTSLLFLYSMTVILASLFATDQV